MAAVKSTTVAKVPVNATVTATPQKTAVFGGGTYAVDAKGIPFGAPIKTGGTGGGGVMGGVGGTGMPAPRASIAPQKVVSASKGGGGTSYATPTTAPLTTSKKSVNINQAVASGGLTQDSITPKNTGNVIQYKDTGFKNPYAGVVQDVKNAWGGVINTVGNAFKGNKSTQGASALQATALPGSGAVFAPPGLVTLPTTAVGKTFASAGVGPQARASMTPVVKPEKYVPNSQTMPLLQVGNDTPLSGNMIGDTTTTPTTSPQVNTGGTTVTKTVDPTTGAVTTNTQNLAPAPVIPQTSPTTSNAITGLTDTLVNTKPDAFTSTQSAGEFQNNQIINYQTSAAKLFNNPQDVINAYNSDPNFASNINKAAAAKGVDPHSIVSGIASKVQTVTNGITGPQTTADFLANNKLVSKDVNKALNDQIALEKNFTQEQKDIYLGNDKVTGMLQQQKDESQAMIDMITRRETARETTEREKAQLAIDKANAEYQAKDAEMEINRQVAKTNLTEFLAHIGALNTDGAAKVGLSILEQKYQAARAALKNTYDTTAREVNMNMNNNINELQSTRDENVLKLNMDLHKSEREIAVDIMKLDHNLQKEIISAKLEYAKQIETAKEKATTKAQSYKNNFNQTFFQIASKGVPSFLIDRMINKNTGEFIPNAENVKVITDLQAGITPEQPASMKVGKKIYKLQPDGTYL